MRIRRKKRYQDIEPDEILIDAQNLPGFDPSQLEGRIERPIEARAYRDFLILALVIGVIFFGQLARLQVIDAAVLKERAEANSLEQTLIISERGNIFDRFYTPLALNNPEPEKGFSKRVYPFGDAAAHLIGYVTYPKRDANGRWFQETIDGRAGIERTFQETLKGSNGVEIKETSATGRIVSGSIIHKPQKGGDITLSIDAGLQKELYDALEERVHGGPFVGGSGAILDVVTGEIYALSSYPSFNPDTVSSGDNTEAIQSYVSDARAPFLDRAVSGLYAPGSVVKPFIALAALEEGIITPEKQILSTGSIAIPNPYNPSLRSVFKDWKAHGWVDMRHAIAVSSDVYFYAIGGGYEDQQGLGIGAIDSYMRRFGFGEASGIAVAGEEAGVVPNPDWKAEMFDGERWFLGNTYHTAIGQYGFQVTPIQLARASAALANGGFLITPTLEKDARGARVTLDLKEGAIGVVQEGMRLAAMPGGTAQALNVSGVSVAGKTGTAEVGVRNEFINSAVIGFFPYENPRFAFAIVMERAKAGTLSGAPLVMRNVLEWIVANRPEMTAP